MNKIHKSNLAKTAIYLLEEVKNSKFNMDAYALEKNGNWIPPMSLASKYKECGTVCCFAGHAPMALKINQKSKTWKTISWVAYVKEIFGTGESENDWKFLFSFGWANLRKQAAARAVVFLESGVPEGWEGWNFDNKFLPRATNKQLIERLRPFVISKHLNQSNPTL